MELKKRTDKKSMCFLLCFSSEQGPVFLYTRREVLLFVFRVPTFCAGWQWRAVCVYSVVFSESVTSFYSGFHNKAFDQEVDAISIFDLRLMCSRWTRWFARSSALAFAVNGVVQ